MKISMWISDLIVYRYSLMEKIMKIRINKNPLNYFWILCTVIYLKPTYFDSIPILDDFLSLLGIVLFLFLMLMYFKHVHIEKFFVLVVFFVSTPLIQTILKDGDIVGCFSAIIQYVSIFLLLRLEVYYDETLIYKVTLPVMKILIVINYLTIVLCPNGLYQIKRVTGWTSSQAWFLGLRNGIPFWVIFFCMLLFMDFNGKKTRKKDVFILLFYLGICVCTLIKVTGGGAKVAAVCLIIYILFRKQIRKFNLQYMYCLFQFSFFLIAVVLQIHEKILFPIVNVLNRDITFTGRTYVWKAVLKWISKSPIIGWGVERGNVILLKISVRGDTAFVKCHNMYLDILYSGGFVMFFLFILILFLILHENRNTESRIWSCISFFFFFVVLLLGQTETAIYAKPFIFMLFTCYFANKWKNFYSEHTFL